MPTSRANPGPFTAKSFAWLNFVRIFMCP